jgi:hypothetical protein
MGRGSWGPLNVHMIFFSEYDARHSVRARTNLREASVYGQEK